MAKFLARFSQALQKNKTRPAVSPTFDANLGVGTLIDQRYRLDMEIGRGGMGVVYRAHDLQNDRDVAIKVIDMNSANALSLQQFAREAKITSRLNHPHIVEIYETGSVESSPFMVMELVQGRRLDEIRDFTYDRIVDIGKQICDALGYAHDQGYVYRDLKPGNVILEKRGFHYIVKLLDFGLAHRRGETYLPNESTAAGTVFYLAPELIAGQPADIGTDLYALGATLYEMITGRVPFSNIDERNIISQHLEEKVSPPSQSRSGVPPALDAIVLRLLEKNPKDRFTTAHEVYDALEQVRLSRRSASNGNLPYTSSAGRENEISQIIKLFETNQLVTLLNDDEILALAVGGKLSDQFTDGVWLVQLKSVAEPAMILRTAMTVLGIKENPNRPPVVTLIESLREKNLLLILAHCDHLLGACTQFVETITRACPEVYVLTTSHHPLNISVEKCYRYPEDTIG